MSTDRTTEMLNYLSAISREIGIFRQETNARFDKVDERLDKMEHRMERVERETRDMRRTLDIVGSGVLAQRAKVDELDERVSELEGKRA